MVCTGNNFFYGYKISKKNLLNIFEDDFKKHIILEKSKTKSKTKTKSSEQIDVLYTFDKYEFMKYMNKILYDDLVNTLPCCCKDDTWLLGYRINNVRPFGSALDIQEFYFPNSEQINNYNIKLDEIINKYKMKEYLDKLTAAYYTMPDDCNECS